MRPRERSAALFLAALCLPLGGCLNHYVLHPKRPPESVVTWRLATERDGLGIRMEWAAPRGEGPFPAVLVHPEAGHTAREMRGVLHALAAEGYLAAAAQYRPRRGGNQLFAWRERGDVTAALGILRADPRADRERAAALGFSQGGVYSLLIAAEEPALRAAIAYYPVTDFELWLADPERRGPRRLAFKLIGWALRRRSGARSDEEFAAILARGSALRRAADIRAPVLLVHGDRDTSAGLGESRRMAAHLEELGRDVQLVVVEDAGHVFNFRDRRKAAVAWEATLAWLGRYLR